MIESIPLSWLRSDIASSTFRSVRLPLSGLIWIHSAEIPSGCPFEEVYDLINSRFSGRFLIRGCTPEIARFLSRNGCDVMKSGSQAEISLGNNHIGPSLGEIVERGLRHGEVAEVPYGEGHRDRVSGMKAASPHASKPFLRYLFRTDFDPGMRCFVLMGRDRRWLGAVTVSEAGGRTAHIEMMLRDSRSPVGVMEAVIVTTAGILREEGFRTFSLGEVPFVSAGHPGLDIPGRSMKERLLRVSGRLLKFAYDYESLFSFKDKFDPLWSPVYICASPGLSWRALADLFVKTRYMELSQAELINNFKGFALSYLFPSDKRYNK